MTDSPLAAYIAVTSTIALTVCGQMLQKRVADNRAHSARMAALQFYFRQSRFWYALICLGLAMLAWIYALAYLDISKAYALLSANYLLVPLVARRVFGESMSIRQWSGAVVLSLGLILIGQS